MQQNQQQHNLVDLSQRSESATKQEHSAMRMFIKYLKHQNIMPQEHGVLSLNDINDYRKYLTEDMLNESLFGRFASFIQKEGKKFATFMNYMSQVKGRIERDFKKTDIFETGNWYSNFITRVKTSFQTELLKKLGNNESSDSIIPHNNDTAFEEAEYHQPSAVGKDIFYCVFNNIMMFLLTTTVYFVLLFLLLITTIIIFVYDCSILFYTQESIPQQMIKGSLRKHENVR